MATITVLDKGNVPTGPFTREEVLEKLQSGVFSPGDLAFVEGLSQWTPLSEVLAKTNNGVTSVPLSYTAPTPSQPAAVPAYSYAATMEPPSHLVYAGFWIRVLAHLLDNLIVSIPFIVLWVGVILLFVAIGVMAPLTNMQSRGNLSDAAAMAMVGTIIILYVSFIVGRLVAVWLYHALLESGVHQATWGKRIMGLKVTSLSGRRITFGHASGRYFSTLVTNMTMGVGYLMVAFTDKKQALHDMIASTVVVRN